MRLASLELRGRLPMGGKAAPLQETLEGMN